MSEHITPRTATWSVGWTALPLAAGGTGRVYAVSSDGTTAVGQVVDGSGHTLACYWNPTAGPITITSPSDGFSEAYGVSPDSLVIVGNTGTQPFIWHVGDSSVTVFGTSNDVVIGMSADGSTIFGTTYVSGSFQACRWNRSFVRTLLGFLPGHNRSEVLSASSDGSYLVGDSMDTSTSNTQRAFLWTAAGGMVNLGVTSGQSVSSAYGVADNGSVVAVDQNFLHAGAARWTPSGGMVSLPRLAGDVSTTIDTAALGISRDGGTIVGQSDYIDSGGHPINRYCLALWTAHGINVLAPGVFTGGGDPASLYPNGVSDDASVIVGWTFGGSELPWVYHTPPPPVTMLTDSELVFAPLNGFYDFHVESTRRLFVSLNGTPAWMGGHGEIPFNAPPAVYLTTQGPPLNFAQNNGSGGGFAPTPPVDPADGPGCSPYYVTEAAGAAANPEWRLTTSDNGGRTWSTLVKPRSSGALGVYLTRLRWQKMGQSRQRMVRLECTDPVRRNIVGIYIDADQGMS